MGMNVGDFECGDGSMRIISDLDEQSRAVPATTNYSIRGTALCGGTKVSHLSIAYIPLADN